MDLNYVLSRSHLQDSPYSGSKAAGVGYQQPPAAHQPQPAHQSSYERQAAAYQQYAQQYAQQQSPPASYQQASPQQQQQQQQQHTAPAAHGGYLGEHASAAAAAYHHQQQPSSLYAQQAAAAQYNAQMLANYASVANMGMAPHAGRGRPKGSPNKSGKRKKNKDPNRPKRPTSAYFFYVAHCRAECEKRGERITRVAQWTKEISQAWREMSPEERKKFDEKAVLDKARYEEQMNRYKGRDKNRPKRPQSAYFLWLAGFRNRMKDKIPVNKELLRAAGEHWKRLTEVEKAPYEQMAEGERRKYEEAMRQYNMSGGAKRARMGDMGGVDASSSQGSPSTPQQQQPASSSAGSQPSSQASTQQQPPSQSTAPSSNSSPLPVMSTTTALVPPGMHPSMMAAINMMGMQQSMSMQQQAQAMGLAGGNPGNPQAGKNGQAVDDSDEYDDDDDEEYTDDDDQ